MASFSVDSNCIIAAVSAWHPFHDVVAAEINGRRERGEALVAPAHALAEAYAVLTRLPAPHRLSSSEAWAVLSGSFVPSAKVAALSGTAYTILLRRLAREGAEGGRVYDAVIGETVRRARVETLLTLNPRHFDPPPAGVIVVDPSQ